MPVTFQTHTHTCVRATRPPPPQMSYSLKFIDGLMLDSLIHRKCSNKNYMAVAGLLFIFKASLHIVAVNFEGCDFVEKTCLYVRKLKGSA